MGVSWHRQPIDCKCLGCDDLLLHTNDAKGIDFNKYNCVRKFGAIALKSNSHNDPNHCATRRHFRVMEKTLAVAQRTFINIACRLRKTYEIELKTQQTLRCQIIKQNFL
ncbi:MAG TPA: hypothetical protein VE944_07790 [Nostoc sp.]|uniref:hypothetical protein n=1 Tax=Nostoc sp. TaxID=1180 RepID=UPI002D393C8D|nr:hypothetical protein [Nostoc sp.]HYX14256.1 hypothetical protein [Nostoc sp.]